MITGDEMARLVIYGMTPDDAGAYSIYLSNTFGQATDAINVSVVGTSHRQSNAVVLRNYKDVNINE